MANDKLMKPVYIILLIWTELRKITHRCLFQLECRGDHVHPSCRFPSLLAQEADANAAHDPSRKLRVHLSGVGRPFGHCQRPGASGADLGIIEIVEHTCLAYQPTNTSLQQTY